jgi:hypothetical protein
MIGVAARRPRASARRPPAARKPLDDKATGGGVEMILDADIRQLSFEHAACFRKKNGRPVCPFPAPFA